MANLFSGFIYFFQQINAQVQTKKLILLSTAKSLDIESRASYSDALIKAKEKDGPYFTKPAIAVVP